MVRVAPLKIPFERRLQTAAVLVVALTPVILILCNIFCILNPLMWPLYIGYLLWMVADSEAPHAGTRKQQWIRSLPIWKYFKDYFPARVIKTVDLDPQKTYMFGMHPHGIIGVSLFANFMNDMPTSFSQCVGTINLRLVTLSMNFLVPFFRDFLMAVGLVDANKSTIMGLLERGVSVLVMVGGAEESLYARPGAHDLVLSRRRGFVRCALQAGAHLVPVYTFGENELYDQVPNPEGSRLRRLQDAFKNLTGVALPAFHGRGIMQYDYGFLPHRIPLITIIGEPIECPLINNPSDEEVNSFHQLYVSKLAELVAKHKGSDLLKVL